jgi:hypothetical protein
MIWVDVETGATAFAVNDFYGCFLVGSRTFGSKDSPAMFKTAFADWKKKRQTLAHDCTYFLDGRNRVASVVPID